MDSSKSINSLGFNHISPLRSTEMRKPAAAAMETEQAPSVAADGVQLSGVSNEFELAGAVATPAASAPAYTEREAVPVHLRDEDLGSSLLGGTSSRSNLSSVASLGLLAQLDEAAPVQAVRAIDGPSQPNAFADLHLVGPSSAARFLANPKELYLGA